MDKKIASEFAIGVILLLAIIVGVFFLAQDMRRSVSENSAKVEQGQPIRRAVEKQVSAPTEIASSAEQIVDVCTGHLYEGEATLSGTYSLETVPGTTKKDWMFKVIKQDIEKLPVQEKTGESEIVKNLLFIVDATPEMITIKGIYVDCEGVSIVSIEPARIALAKYIKK